MTKFRKKPIVIEAVRWRGYTSGLGITAESADQPVEITADNMAGVNWGKLPKWLPAVTHVVSEGGEPPNANPRPGEIWRNNEDLWVGTLEGAMICSPGDWIILGVKGELYPCKPDIFAATYDEVIERTEGLTISQLEKILQEPADPTVRINTDGSVTRAVR